MRTISPLSSIYYTSSRPLHYIITQVEGVVPGINKMAEDEQLRASFVDE
ncbi:hypothetical protein METHB2_780019 [Candidatus Methylobacter favarea]|uniref:Uncharacterized protein n=1 Tax=Candidatus Methylobacter favarea TaxID=2707345 RepID=A0A8S0WSE2_9GAMM|nr:hypothetical protein [Candidatus Methylobacter favarea]CAA9892661.1 hypothetical protein METHB2_780019 [Candidatus Methylobacter favarea]